MAIIPQDVDEVWRFAIMIKQAGMAPKSLDSPEKITIAIMTGLEVGLKPLQAVQGIAVINGNPSIWGDAAIGLVMGSGLVEDIKEFIECEGDLMTAKCVIKRKGIESPVTGSFSVGDAKCARLWGKAGPWTQYPKRMLQMRARGFALRDSFPDILKGLKIQEEVLDYEPRRPRNNQSEGTSAKAIIDQSKGIVTEEKKDDVEDAEIEELPAETPTSNSEGEAVKVEPEDPMPPVDAGSTTSEETVEPFQLIRDDDKRMAPDQIITVIDMLKSSEDVRHLVHRHSLFIAEYSTSEQKVVFACRDNKIKELSDG